jgi:mannose-6-phosphate isomerase-like protein (cupin superfamily)
MSHTIKDLRDVEDSAPKFGFSERQEARFCRTDLDAEGTGVALMNVKPGQRQAFAHKHDEAEEVYFVISGSGRIKLDDDVFDVRPYDAIRIAPHVTRALEGGPDGLEYLAFGPHHDGDGELIQDPAFWDQPAG